MITIYTRPQCAYCPMVKKYFDLKKVQYTVKEAEGELYEQLSRMYGYSVPLIYNDQTNDGTTGYNIPILKRIAGL